MFIAVLEAHWPLQSVFLILTGLLGFIRIICAQVSLVKIEDNWPIGSMRRPELFEKERNLFAHEEFGHRLCSFFS
jgi:hypothetical protein